MKKLITFLILIVSFSSCTPKIGNKTEILTGENIIEDYIEALGGRKNLLKVKTMTMIAVVEVQGVEFQIESYREAPNKMTVKMKSLQGTLTRTLNGDEAFVIDANGNIPITGLDLNNLKEEATIFPVLYHQKFGHQLEYVGLEKVGMLEAHKVKITLSDGTEKYEFFDQETKLLVKLMDEFGSESYFSNYKEIQGVKIPHTGQLVNEGGALDLDIIAVQINPVYEEDLFNF